MGSFIFLGIIILLSLPSLIRVAGVWSICLMLVLAVLVED